MLLRDDVMPAAGRDHRFYGVSKRAFMVGAVAAALCWSVASSSAFGAEPADYAKTENWLCLPDREDACDIDLSTTVVAPDGSTQVELWPLDPEPEIDCFYVYPTVSRDPGGNADLSPGPGELGVVRTQLARFGSACRIFAPIYQQITLTALVARFSGGSIESDRALAVGDVFNAWNYYLEHYNQGRGVVLIGHSQGSGMLKALIQQQIDGNSIQRQIVSALLLGTNVLVPKGSYVGGDFQHMPLCRNATQTGCVVTYVTYRETSPPPARALFGRSRQAERRVGCTNPAALAGGAVTVEPYLAAPGVQSQTMTWAKDLEVSTPFVTVPGLLTAECVERDGASYLEVRINADPSDPRTDDIAGDVIIGGQINAGWGLHLVDVDVVMGDLVDLVQRQAGAYLGTRR